MFIYVIYVFIVISLFGNFFVYWSIVLIIKRKELEKKIFKWLSLNFYSLKLVVEIWSN